jgi:hypothetical protein
MHLTSSSLKNKDNQTELPYQDLQSPACYIWRILRGLVS